MRGWLSLRHRELGSGQRGFSLIELSIIIAVAATLMVGYLSLVQPESELKANATFTTMERMRAVMDSIEAFRVKYKRLPCPAEPKVRSDSTTVDGSTPVNKIYGGEGLDYSSGMKCTNNLGSVPFRNLGIKPEMMYDGWGRKFTYHVSSQLCAIGTSAGNDGCTPYSYNKNVGDLIVSEDGTTLTANGGYVIVSHGRNGLGAYLASGNRLPVTAATTQELENANKTALGVDAINKTYNIVATNAEGDDIVMYRTKDYVNSTATDVVHLMVSEADCAGNTAELSKINKTLAQTIDTSLYPTSTTGFGAYDPNYTGSRVALTIMWALQDECYHLYGDIGVAPTTPPLVKSCPGAAATPPNGATYNDGDHTCDCPSGDWDAC